MDLTGIISISGKAGLYKVVAQGKNNIIVESLDDKKRSPAYSTDRISALDDISIYTYDEDQSLKDIFVAIYKKEEGKACISHKEDKQKLISYLLEVLPNYDQERVYISDVKKIFQWYNMLHKSGDLKLEEEAPKVKKDKTSTEGDKKTSAKEKTPTKEKKATVVKPKTPAKPKSSPKATTTKKVTAPKTESSRGK